VKALSTTGTTASACACVLKPLATEALLGTQLLARAFAMEDQSKAALLASNSMRIAACVSHAQNKTVETKKSFTGTQ